MGAPLLSPAAQTHSPSPSTAAAAASRGACGSPLLHRRRAPGDQARRAVLLPRLRRLHHPRVRAAHPLRAALRGPPPRHPRRGRPLRVHRRSPSPSPSPPHHRTPSSAPPSPSPCPATPPPSASPSPPPRPRPRCSGSPRRRPPPASPSSSRSASPSTPAPSSPATTPPPRASPSPSSSTCPRSSPPLPPRATSAAGTRCPPTTVARATTPCGAPPAASSRSSRWSSPCRPTSSRSPPAGSGPGSWARGRGCTPKVGTKVLDEAATEFAGVEDMIKVGEALFGPYEWERFDLLVLPPSFPYGGMENPRMVFLTPTVIKGDAAGAQVVAHELAHSWTGNLITNKTNEDFWLNEGFTTYAERRIVEVVQGEERAALSMGIGWRGLNQMMERFKDNMEFTKLKPKMAGIDPDDVYSKVPYEKGFQFLWRIERQIGRPAFDEFIKKYIATFKFQSIDTETFLEFLKANVPGIENQIDLHLWVEGTGIPPDAMEPDSAIYKKICSLAAEFKSGKIPSEDEVADWNGQEWELYLENLPTDVEASQVTALDERYKLSESRDYEVKVAFLQLAIHAGCKCYFNEVEKCLKQVGRMRYLRLLYTSLAKCSDEEKMLAQRIFSEAQEFYHPIARGVAESILSKNS